MENTEPSAKMISEQARNAVLRKAKDEWLSFFADDAVIKDPVGKSPLDPTGNGHCGKEAISTFWDNNIGPVSIEFDFKETYDVGQEIAYVGTLHITGEEGSLLGEGTKLHVDGVYVYRINDDGKLVSLKAYWEFEKTMATLG